MIPGFQEIMLPLLKQLKDGKDYQADKLGLDIIYIQAKRWQQGNIVGRPEIHKFIGALVGQGAKKGIF